MLVYKLFENILNPPLYFAFLSLKTLNLTKLPLLKFRSFIVIELDWNMPSKYIPCSSTLSVFNIPYCVESIVQKEGVLIKSYFLEFILKKSYTICLIMKMIKENL